MEISSVRKELLVTINLNEREAKILACLIGALNPLEAEAAIQRGINFSEWIGKLENREVTDFTGNLYEDLYEILGG